MTDQAEIQGQDTTKLRVDIVSDVVCPWCIVGYRQLQQALEDKGLEADIHWHPFELNPAMPPEGENLREHIQRKYGSSAEQSDAARAHLSKLGRELGIDFAFSPDSRIVNTFRAHQLIDLAAEQGLQSEMKLALFRAYFEQGRDVSNADVLTDLAAEVGLDADQVKQIVTQDARLGIVRQKQKFWTEQGISGVPAMVFQGKYLVTGAQGVENYTRFLDEMARAGALDGSNAAAS